MNPAESKASILLFALLSVVVIPAVALPPVVPPFPLVARPDVVVSQSAKDDDRDPPPKNPPIVEQPEAQLTDPDE